MLLLHKLLLSGKIKQDTTGPLKAKMNNMLNECLLIYFFTLVKKNHN